MPGKGYIEYAIRTMVTIEYSNIAGVRAFKTCN